jgi:hypothetical protein
MNAGPATAKDPLMRFGWWYFKGRGDISIEEKISKGQRDENTLTNDGFIVCTLTGEQTAGKDPLACLGSNQGPISSPLAKSAGTQTPTTTRVLLPRIRIRTSSQVICHSKPDAVRRNWEASDHFV